MAARRQRSVAKDPGSQILEINPCPVCANAHRYRLEVDVAAVAQYFPEPDGEEPLVKKFVRIFTCAVHNQRFQAAITLTQEPGQRIKDVRVAGAAGDPRKQP